MRRAIIKIKFITSIFFFILFISCKEHTTSTKDIVNEVKVDTNTIATLVSKQKTIEKPVIEKDFILGKYDYKKHIDFEKVSPNHSSKTIYIQKDTYKAFINMFDAAKLDGINLKIISGTRSFYEQKGIWERKWEKYKALKPLDRAKKILEYSSMPTTSRHHWGTDIDINNLNNGYFDNGQGKKEYEWLVKNANTYGFYQVYTSKNQGRTGYNLEKWHWSYLPLASTYLKFYNDSISYDDIIGFKGFELAKQCKMISDYVNGISKVAKAYK